MITLCAGGSAEALWTAYRGAPLLFSYQNLRKTVEPQVGAEAIKVGILNVWVSDYQAAEK